jgi:hypothetical protein
MAADIPYVAALRAAPVLDGGSLKIRITLSQINR